MLHNNFRSYKSFQIANFPIHSGQSLDAVMPFVVFSSFSKIMKSQAFVWSEIPAERCTATCLSWQLHLPGFGIVFCLAMSGRGRTEKQGAEAADAYFIKALWTLQIACGAMLGWREVDSTHNHMWVLPPLPHSFSSSHLLFGGGGVT